jgi:CheY-like chemotaxis protein
MARTLLVADRDRDFSELLHTFLSDRGFQVNTALSGIDCVDKMRRLKPDAVVLDLDLLWGGADGVIDWMREQSSDIPVIVTATSNAVENVRFPIIKLLPNRFRWPSCCVTFMSPWKRVMRPSNWIVVVRLPVQRCISANSE